MAILSSNELVKYYRKRAVVNGVSIEVNTGEVVGLLGPNGAGKTTTFYMIIGFIRPDGGNVFWHSRRERNPKNPWQAGRRKDLPRGGVFGLKGWLYDPCWR